MNVRFLLLSTLTACTGLDRWSGGPTGSLDAHLGARERDAVAEILAHDEALPPFWREEKACRMAVGPFPFFRATAYLMHDDLVGFETDWNGALTWVQGDAHPQNIGAFGDDHDQVVFDLDDFDEGFVGDPLHDLWRLVAGTELLADELDHGDGARRDAAEAVVDGWLAAIEEHAGDDSERGVMTADTAFGRVDEFLEDVEDEDREDLLDSWADDGLLRTDRSGHVAVDDDTWFAVADAVWAYRSTVTSSLAGEPGWFHVKDVVAIEGTGLGSLGTPRFAVLIEGPSGDDDDDRILDVKRQGVPSAWSAMSDAQRALTGDASAERVITATRAMRMDVDDHLGVLELDDGAYTVRERSPWKASLPAEAISTRTRLEKAATQWGWVLGTAHARGDIDAGAGIAVDIEQTLLARIDDRSAFLHAAVQIGRAYADTVRADHRAFIEQVGCPR